MSGDGYPPGRAAAGPDQRGAQSARICSRNAIVAQRDGVCCGRRPDMPITAHLIMASGERLILVDSRLLPRKVALAAADGVWAAAAVVDTVGR